jgi:hypothetical protein
VIAGTPLTGSVTLDFPAPAAGFPIRLSSSAPQATVPPTVSVQSGTTKATFTITTAAQLAGSIDVVITASAGTVTLTEQFTLQVISVAISPAEMSLSGGHSQQFAATVTGTADQTVNWSVQELGGGSVNASGLYTAPAGAGTFHVVAASAVDPNKKASAVVHVVPKQKDKEKEKEIENKALKDRLEKSFEKNFEKNFEKVRHLEVMPTGMNSILLPGLEQMPSTFETRAAGRAFIRPAERPDPMPFANAGDP